MRKGEKKKSEAIYEIISWRQWDAASILSYRLFKLEWLESMKVESFTNLSVIKKISSGCVAEAIRQDEEGAKKKTTEKRVILIKTEANE